MSGGWAGPDARGVGWQDLIRGRRQLGLAWVLYDYVVREARQVRARAVVCVCASTCACVHVRVCVRACRGWAGEGVVCVFVFTCDDCVCARARPAGARSLLRIPLGAALRS